MRFALLFLLLFSCQKRTETENPESPVEVVTYLVEPQPVPIDFSFIGVVQSSHQVQIRSRVEGTLNHIAYKEGTTVKAGDLLFQINPRRFEDVVKEAQGNLEKERAALWQAQQTLERLKPLYEQKAASKKDVDDATVQVLAEEASISILQARLDEAELDLNDTSITSPIEGITSSSLYQEGTLISPNANGTLTTVSVLDPVWVILNISESFFLTNLEEVAKGEWYVPENANFTVTLTLSNGSEFPYSGKVNFISPLYNQSTGTLTTRAVFPNPTHTLKPGQFVNAQVSGAIRLNCVIVPQESVQQGDIGHYVYVVNEDKQAEIRPIVVGNWYQEYWIVKSGLQAGDRVIKAGVNKVENGTLVKIKKNK